MTTFKHSGDLGDIIYALPAIRALGGGILYLDVSGGKADPLLARYAFRGRTNFSQQQFETIRPLLLEQPYISDVRVWRGEMIDFNLDRFRETASTDLRTNLACIYLRTFGLDESRHNEPWLQLRSPPIRLEKPVVVNRTARYQAKYHWWLVNHHKFLHRAVFIGQRREHEIFEYTFDCKIEYRPVEDALEIGRVLSGSEALIGNQSFVMSIAIGLGISFYQEVYDSCPNCLFERSGANYF